MFILSRIFLLIIPISDFVGFMSLHDGLFLKFGLWSFSVMNACCFAVVSTQLSISRLVAMSLSFLLMSCMVVLSAFL